MSSGFSGKRLPCPECKKEGRDSRGDHLGVFNDGRAGWCRIHGHVPIDDEGGGVDNSNNRWNGGGGSKPLDLAVIQRLPFRSLEDRGVSKETCEKYGVRVSIDEQTGDVDAHLYPYTDADGTVTGYKKRTLPKQFSVIGKVKGLFGQHLCKGGRFLVVFEGECDALAAHEMLALSGKSFNCVSIPNGANEDGKLDQILLRELEWMASFEGVAICFDMDAPGQSTAKQLADTLASQTKVKIVKLPVKDAGEMHKRGMHKEFLKALYDAKPYHPEQVVEGRDLDIKELMTPKQPGVEIPYPKLQKMTWGLRKGEITLLTAGSGIGKSTFARELAYYLIGNGHKVAFIALETQMDDVARFLIAMDNNVPAYKLMFNPNIIPPEKYKASYDWMMGSNQTHFFKHWGSIDAQDLQRKMMYFAKALGVDFIILDHCSMVVAGNESSDERKDLDRLFEGMTRVCVETGVGIIPIIHLKRVPGKSYNKGDEVELTDLRGSAGAEQMSFNVWALERDQQSENKKDIVRLRNLKNRLLGFTGLADTLIYNHETGRLELFEAEYE